VEVAASSNVEERLALALEAAQLWTWDMVLGTTVWDVRLEELHGMAPGAFGGAFEDWVAALHPGDRAECLDRVNRALAAPGPYELLHRTIWPDGSVHWIECRGRVLVDQDGQATGTTGVAADVTERKARESRVTGQLAAERRLVDVLQTALLPEVPPSVPGVSVAAVYRTAVGPTEIGGDWYAMVPLAEGRLGLAIGDVAGHGLDAVADMAAARFSLRALALTGAPPDVVLGQLNDVVRIFGDDTMVTALYGILDPAARTWTFANAGHCPAVIRGADDIFLASSPADPPLGVASSFTSHEVQLPPEATLVLYTDGLIERRDEDLVDGFDRLLASCRRGPDDPSGLCDHLVSNLVGDTNQDDVAIVAVTLSGDRTQPDFLP
jgi:PAS domain S-box-containing protein